MTKLKDLTACLKARPFKAHARTDFFSSLFSQLKKDRSSVSSYSACF
jgi:hypothetical protein